MKFVVDIKLEDGTEEVKTIEGADANSARSTAEKLLGKDGIVTGITELTDWVLGTTSPDEWDDGS